MSITDRDRKILLALIPLVAIVAYWFLLLAPQRKEAAKIKDELSQAEQVRDTAQQKASQLSGAKRSFAADYATVIRLGKSIPASVDMPSLLVQLDRAARGTGIKFTDVKTGDRSSTPGAPAPAPAPASSSGTPGGGSSGPTAPGAAPAQSAPGTAAQNASNAVGSANGQNAAGAAAAGSPPAGGTGAPGATGAPGLESVPLDFEFRGSFFQLADFFHHMKRFVRVVNDRIVIRGRLMTINSFTFDSSENFPEIKAQVSATVYLAPKAQGVDAGASPTGPAPASGGAPQTASSAGSSSPSPTPTATVMPR
jgi:Tfp pilus assembly protein PilO